MNLTRIKRGLPLVAAAALAFTSISVPAQAEQRQVDGHLWTQSTTAQKQAYLIGVANTLAVESAYAQKKGVADPNGPTARYLRSMDVSTIDAIQRQLDSWYENNPSRLDVPVLGVIWLAYVTR